MEIHAISKRLRSKSLNNSSLQWIFPKKATQNHKMRYQCFHLTQKPSKATSESAIFDPEVWIHSDEGVTLETSVFESFRVANLLSYLVLEFKAFKSLEA